MLFVLFTFGLSWMLVPFFDRAWLTESSVPARLLGVVLPYALVMGWQPVAAVLLVRAWVEPDETLDAGLRPALRRYMGLASLGSLGLLTAASVVKWAAASPPVAWSVPLSRTIHASVSMFDALAGVPILAVTLLLIWAQAVAEEIGFRGYLLPRSMQLFGTWPGLLLHAVLWGIWYAPLVLLSQHGLLEGLAASGTFAVTCILLGALLGCLRLSAASITPSCAANSILTLIAGLPFFLHGTDVGLRTAAYEPFGWLPMLLILIGIRFAGLPRPFERRRFRHPPRFTA
jgi:membrane protease YdiL (CAAX protease family)